MKKNQGTIDCDIYYDIPKVNLEYVSCANRFVKFSLLSAIK